MKQILAAMDFSTRSRLALRRAGLLAQTIDGAITLVHAVDEDQPKQIVDVEVREAARFLSEQIDSLPELRGVQCRPEVVVADPFDGILRIAKALAADLIVMGTHRKQLLRDVFVGTTIERVLRTGPYPVLMVNGEADHAYRSILASVDMSDASAQALITAEALGFLDGVRVTVAHAFVAAAKGKMYIADTPTERIAAYIAELQLETEKEIAAFLRASGFESRGWQRHVREGAAIEVISVAVETMKPDLVVVGTHGRSGIAKLFLGSVTESLLRSLKTDILAVPPSRQVSV